MTVCQSWDVLQRCQWFYQLSPVHWQRTHWGLAGSWLGLRSLQLWPARLSNVLKVLCHKTASYRKVPKPWNGANLRLSETPDSILWNQEPGQSDMPILIPTQLLYLKQHRMWPQEPQLNSLLAELPDGICKVWKLQLSGCAHNPAAQTQKCTGTFLLWQAYLFLSYV